MSPRITRRVSSWSYSEDREVFLEWFCMVVRELGEGERIDVEYSFPSNFEPAQPILWGNVPKLVRKKREGGE